MAKEMIGNQITASTLSKLAQYDTPTICNIIEVFEVRPKDVGFMDQRIQAAFPEMPSMVGFAATASLRSASSSSGNAYAMLEAQLKVMEQLPGPTVVVFQDLDEPPVGATFGDVMCSTYQAFGAVGLITSGGGRDLEQVRALKFPAFMGSTICSRAYSHTVDVGSQVCVGGLEVQTGNLLHGDANGVTSIPLEIAVEVAEVAEQYVAAEALVIEYVQATGKKEIAELGERRRAMGEAISAIRHRVLGK